MATPDSIVTSFEEVVSQNPAGCALRWNGGSWSYAELNARANRLAHFLIAAGVRAETPVGVFSLRSPEALTAFLAILKTGGAYVPLDPSHPAERIKYYLEDAAIRLVLADPREVSRLPATDAKVVPLDGPLAENQPETNPQAGTGPHSLAHILYTSGSTGRPKGVLIEHRGILRLTRHIDYLDIGPGETLLQYAPLSFDISTFEIWAVWLNGACLAVPPPLLVSLHALGSVIRSLQVSCMTLTANLMALMVEQEIDSLASVRQLLTGGDVVSPIHAERFLRKYPGSRLINAYGPTENSVLTSCHSIRLEDPMPTRLSIGRPIRETGVLILDEKLQLVPTGKIGEMVMTGEGVARGYLHQPELTERSFVEVADASGKRVRGYRSGDLGSYNPGGTLEFHGRMDDQVKINGIRIEPGEIKNILQSHPQVSGGEVILVESFGQKRLEIFAVLRPGADVDSRALREFLRSRVPGNWLPPGVRIVDGLPLSPNGKVDRPALLAGIPSATASAPKGVAPVEEPQDPFERAIWNIWREILPGKHIGRHDSFTDLGGDSLAAMNMIAQVEKMIGRPLGMRSLLEGGTIVDLAAAARDTGPVSPPPLMICTQSGAGKPPFFYAHGDYVSGGLYCQRMAHQIGADQPLYSFAPHGTFGGDLPPTFEEIAAGYLELIHSVQPKGPYHLGGFCNGAVAMYEAAQQLIRAGETVRTLVLVDPPPLYFSLLRKGTALGKLVGLPERQCRAAFLRASEAVEIWQHLDTLRLRSQFVLKAIYWSLKRPFRRFRVQKAAAVAEPGPAAMLSTPNLNFHYFHAMARYHTAGYPGADPVWIILREGEKRRRPRQVNYWREMIPHARFELVPGNHMQLRSGLAGIANVIKTALAKAA